MLRRLLIASTLLLAACSASEGALERVSDAQARNDGPAIWVARDDDSTLYLYGTLHLVPTDADWQRPDLDAAFSRAGTVFFEVADDDASALRAERLTQARGYQPPGERLSRDWDQYSTKTLEIAALSADIPLEVLDTLQPWLAAELVTIAAAEKAGLTAGLSPDAALKSRARRRGKFIRYLDTAEEQLALSADVAPDTQLDNLLKLLARYNSIGPELQAIAREWLEGDVDALGIRLASSVTGDAREAVFTARNAKWADELAEWMDGSGTALAAVGVGHLVGEDSLLDMLEARGVEPRRFYAFQGENVIRTVDTTVARPEGD